MEMLGRLLEEIADNTFEVGSWLWVDVLHVNNPHSFYVRPRTYSKYLPLLQSRGSRPDPSEINIGDIYVFKSKMLRCDVRGKVVYCERRGEEILFKLFAVDIGCTEEDVPLNRIWTTQYQMQVPSLVSHCQLADCAPRGDTWDFDAIDAMRSYIEGERAKMVVRSKISDKLIVELYNSRPDDIATLLALTNHTTFGYANHSTARTDGHQTMRKFYAKKELQVGEVLHVRMLSGTLLEQFFVIAMEDFQYYLTDRSNYTAFARSLEDITLEDLKLNSPIGVFYDKYCEFERGLVKEIMPASNTARVQLVDLGLTIDESITKMKMMPDWYLRVAPRALCCCLHMNQTFTSSVAALSYPDVEFQIVVMAVGDANLNRPHVVMISPQKAR